ncbi:MAG: right-handed parallel beta-helix repeat-containing protein, partial [Bacteroidota bacterium]|nr:right-handed parallel beta-helix repeat-containing protein [Bacteroidota bacterium]
IAKSDPDASLTTIRDSFVQYNSHIHHNYIHDSQKGEGLYIGNTKYNEGMHVNVNGQDTLVFPHYLIGVQIHDNIIERTGYDGIQVSSAIENCGIFNNIISYDSQAGVYAQMSGIIMGGGSNCDCYNNRIENGLGTGILMFGLGGNKIYNNLIVNAGIGFFPNDETKRQHGIMMTDLSLIPGKGIGYFNNTIISPRNDGIRILSSESRNNTAKNNLIVNPGSYQEYENDNTAFTGADAFIFTNRVDIDIDTAGNFFFETEDAVDFFGEGKDFYSLANNSCLIDAGISLNQYSIRYDINNQARPQGFAFDVGAFESSISNYRLFPDTSILIDIHPNPASEVLILNYTLETAGQAKIQIVNPFGIVVTKIEDGTLDRGSYSKEISLANFNTGIYLVVANIKGSRSTKRILIIR